MFSRFRVHQAFANQQRYTQISIPCVLLGFVHLLNGFGCLAGCQLKLPQVITLASHNCLRRHARAYIFFVLTTWHVECQGSGRCKA